MEKSLETLARQTFLDVALQQPSSCHPSESEKRQRAMCVATSCAKTMRLTALRQWLYALRPVRGSESNVTQVDVSIIYTLLVSMHLFSRYLAVVVFLFISIRPHADDAKRARSGVASLSRGIRKACFRQGESDFFFSAILWASERGGRVGGDTLPSRSETLAG